MSGTTVDPRRLVLRPGYLPVSCRVHRRSLLVALGLSAALLLLVVVEIGFGQYWIPPGDVLATALGGGPPGDDVIVRDLRMPRALTAALAGASLALAGAIFQTLVRNPLASPDIIGITGTSSAAGVATFLFISPEATPLAAFAGAIGAAALLYALAWRGGLSTYRFVLVGIGLAAMSLALVSYILTRGRVEDISQAAVWLVGSVNNRNWSDVTTLAVGLSATVPLLATLARSLDALSLGEESARALGVRIERARLGLVAVGAVLVAITVAAAGPIGFVALMAPNMARRLAGNSGAATLPVVALTGAVLVVGADLASRALFSTEELPVGVVTAVLGGPFFIYLLLRGNRVRST